MKTSEPTGSDYILEAVIEEGATEIFGLIGEGNAHLIDAINDHGISLFSARHEQVAVMMADGYARSTGTVGVCTLTHGPGVTHGATGIACADRDNVPLVILIGDTDIAGREQSLQYLDHRSLAEPISVDQFRIESIEQLPDILSRAFHSARINRGPVIVEIPGDVQTGTPPNVEYEPIILEKQRPRPDEELIREAVELLESAQTLAILAGGGAVAAGAGSAIERLASHVGAPIALTFFGKGILPDSHPYVSGIAGTFMTSANADLLESVDVLLAVGTRLSGKATRFGTMYSETDIIQIDIDPQTFGTHVQPTIGIVSDAKVAVEEIHSRISSDHDRAKEVTAKIESAPLSDDLPVESDSDHIDPRELTIALSDRLPDDITITVDSGNNTGFPPVFHQLGEHGRMLVNGNFGSMGYALPAAIGAKIADPDRMVCCYTGDGALMQVIQDIETAVRLSLAILIVVYNDSSYGIIRHRQELEFERTTESAYSSPEFDTIARGFGAEAAVVRKIEDLTIVDEFVENEPDRPLLIDARTMPQISRPGFPPY